MSLKWILDAEAFLFRSICRRLLVHNPILMRGA